MNQVTRSGATTCQIRLDLIRFHYSTRPYTARLYTALLDSKTALVSIRHETMRHQSSVHVCFLTFAHFRLLDYQLWTTLLDNSTLGQVRLSCSELNWKSKQTLCLFYLLAFFFCHIDLSRLNPNTSCLLTFSVKFSAT